MAHISDLINPDVSRMTTEQLEAHLEFLRDSRETSPVQKAARKRKQKGGVARDLVQSVAELARDLGMSPEECLEVVLKKLEEEE